MSSRLCEHSGCTAEGLYRAPKSRDRLSDYYVFCLDHVRDYNRTWDYYRGMSQDEIEAHIRFDTVWQRPTWPLGNFSAYRSRDPLDAIRDGFGLFSERQRPEQETEAHWKPRTVEEKALSVLGLKPPTVFAQIKARYKELVKRLHPDANGGDKGAEEQLKVINQAYSTLKQAAQSSGR
ncbi:MAG TPA: J domain-containing protein [Alphaproteobacteria bacterium]|nr:J domain-containing protein [Alphaproteobacteria bacterium]